jgi:hypothetical protein
VTNVSESVKTPEEHLEDARRSVETAIKQVTAAEHTAAELRKRLEATRIPDAPIFEILDEQLEEFVNAPGPKGDK